MKSSPVIPMWNEEAWVEHPYQKTTKAIIENKLDEQIEFALVGFVFRLR